MVDSITADRQRLEGVLRDCDRRESRLLSDELDGRYSRGVIDEKLAAVARDRVATQGALARLRPQSDVDEADSVITYLEGMLAGYMAQAHHGHRGRPQDRQDDPEYGSLHDYLVASLDARQWRNLAHLLYSRVEVVGPSKDLTIIAVPSAAARDLLHESDDVLRVTRTLW